MSQDKSTELLDEDEKKSALIQNNAISDLNSECAINRTDLSSNWLI